MAVNWSGSKARFEETQDQLSPRHFENTGSNLFLYVEFSYLVNIKTNHSRICWYKKIQSKTLDTYSSGHLVLSHLGLAFVLMLRPFFPELVMSTDLLSFEHPSVLLFCIALLTFRFLREVFSIAPIRQRFVTYTFTSIGNRQIHSDLIEIYTTSCADVNISMYQKLLKFRKYYSRKQCVG